MGFFFILYIFAQSIHCGYTLEQPRRGGSNEYPQCTFWIENKKIRYTSAYPSFAIESGVYITRHVFVMKSSEIMWMHRVKGLFILVTRGQ